MRARSAKMARLYRERRELVAWMLHNRPWCEIRWDSGCQGRAADVDEILPRGRGGSILDPANLQTTCRHCHDQKHAHPAEAKQRGVTSQSGVQATVHPVLFCLACGEDRPVIVMPRGYRCGACGLFRLTEETP